MLILYLIIFNISILVFFLNQIELWAKLDMKSYIDYDLGNTVNLYYINCNHPTPVKKLENYDYIPDDARKMNL